MMGLCDELSRAERMEDGIFDVSEKLYNYYKKNNNIELELRAKAEAAKEEEAKMWVDIASEVAEGDSKKKQPKKKKVKEIVT